MRAYSFCRAVVVALLLVACLGAQSLWAQGRSYPAQDYYVAFGPFMDGDYGTAAAAFRSAARAAELSRLP